MGVNCLSAFIKKRKKKGKVSEFKKNTCNRNKGRMQLLDAEFCASQHLDGAGRD